jgi:hypothetical protein
LATSNQNVTAANPKGGPSGVTACIKSASALIGCAFSHDQRISSVLEHRLVRIQGVRLEHHRDIAIAWQLLHHIFVVPSKTRNSPARTSSDKSCGMRVSASVRTLWTRWLACSNGVAGSSYPRVLVARRVKPSVETQLYFLRVS